MRLRRGRRLTVTVLRTVSTARESARPRSALARACERMCSNRFSASAMASIGSKGSAFIFLVSLGSVNDRTRRGVRYLYGPRSQSFVVLGCSDHARPTFDLNY